LATKVGEYRPAPIIVRSKCPDVPLFLVLHRPTSLGKITAMIELEVYAAGVRDLNKILELDHQLEAIAGLRYKVDSNHDLVYLELEEPTITLREIRAIFRKIGFEPRFVGAVPSELRPKTKTQLLSV
jgi:hypothetical protein